MKKWVNNFATRSFRDVADNDYIHARLAYRSRLLPQFLWSSLQAVEKYLKAILLYNRIPAKDVKHNLDRALAHAQSLPFEIRLSRSSKKFINYIDQLGAYRYLEWSYFFDGPKLVDLDRTVWEIRRYCEVLDYIAEIDGESQSMLSTKISRIERSKLEAPQKFRAFHGVLEDIVDTVEHPSRSALVWKNGFFGKRIRRKVRLVHHWQITNAPLTLKPELLDELIQYIYIPREVRVAYRDELARRSRQRNKSHGQ